MRRSYQSYLITLLLLTAAPSVNVWAATFSFDRHWAFPLGPQGTAPESYSELEASLQPEDCGQCHEVPYREWKKSRHSRAMGAGVSGQLHAPWLDEEGIMLCMQCHAPLAEQSPLHELPDGSLVNNRDYDPTLKGRGITCAACHVRRHLRYGPTPGKERMENLPHNGFVEVARFGDSKFCRPCHQFGPGDNRVAGKLLQDTYGEWLKSSYPEKGIHCPNCHMPNREHTWPGIHDPDMVRKGISIDAVKKENRVTVTLSNIGVGHNFPTYVTPRITLRGAVLDESGEEIQRTVDEDQLGWGVTLDLTEEYYDSRIPPGGEYRADFDWVPVERGKKIRIIIQVFPDDFYTRFFKALLEAPPDGIDLAMIRIAYEESKKSAYTLFTREWEI
ncbi:MAG: hypothetical protein IME96_12655 [Proteobacteria bacterium]|nr:hypothetical protein [Pseudomonadota bacterium]